MPKQLGGPLRQGTEERDLASPVAAASGGEGQADWCLTGRVQAADSAASQSATGRCWAAGAVARRRTGHPPTALRLLHPLGSALSAAWAHVLLGFGPPAAIDGLLLGVGGDRSWRH